jgi:biotin operon repressor
LGEGQHSEESIVQQLGLKSRLPLWSRIEHLEERGMVRILKKVAA